MESSSEKKIESRLRFHRIMATSLWSHVFGPPCTMTRITATIVSSISLQLQHDALVSVSEMCTSHELKGYVVYVSIFLPFSRYSWLFVESRRF